MCGIAGIAFADAAHAADPQMLTRMQAALAHRGPDDAGTWQDHGCALVHRRLSILDPTPAGRQPMRDTTGRYVVSYNGELYNFRDLRHDLEAHGHTFRTQCDTEVLLSAWAQWGDAALDRFDGMFAFALWDDAEQTLYLARDHAGIKPLYYAETLEGLVFASELSALLASGLIEKTVDPRALDAYFAYGYIPEPECIYRGVERLRPGHVLRYAGGRATLRRWHTLRWSDGGATAEDLRHALYESVGRQRISDVPLGAFLSGGVDSSAVVAILGTHTADAPRTFTIGFGDRAADELAHARRVADHCRTRHTEVIATPALAELLPRIAWHFGEPFADSSALPTWLVALLAREHVTVALSGDGGDELFAGYTWLHRTLTVARLQRLPLHTLAHGLAGALPRGSVRGKFTRFANDLALPPLDILRRRETTFDAPGRAALLRAEWRAVAPDRFAEAAAHAAAWPEQGLAADFHHYLPGDILTKVDRMSMAHGLEVRVPLLGRRVVEIAAQLPFTERYAHSESKRVLKAIVRPLLPPETLRQRKRGFAVPIQRWFRSALAEHYRAHVLVPEARCRDYFDPAATQHLLEEHLAHREDHGHRLYAVLMFEHWLRAVHHAR